MPSRRVRVIKTKAYGTYARLRVMVNLRREQLDRLDWQEGTVLEAADHADGILLRRAREP